MGNLSIFEGGNVPAYLQDTELDSVTKSLMGTSSGKRLSIRGSVFRLIVNGEQIAKNEERSVNLVIAAAAEHVSRTYYEQEYSEDVVSPPRCWSSDGEKPDEGVASPMSSTCAMCPMNVAGSGQGDSRACRFSHRLAVLFDGDLEGDMFQLTLPATSLFGKGEKGGMPLRQYVRTLAGHKVPVTAVVTEARFDTESATPRLTFKPVRPLTKEEFELVKERGSSQEAKEAVTYTVFQMDHGSDISEETANVLQGAQAMVEEVEEEVEEVVEEAVEEIVEEIVEEAEEAEEDEDEIAALERQLEEARKKKLAAKKAAKKATKAATKAATKTAATETQGVTKRASKKAADPVATAAASIMEQWANDGDEEFDD